MSGLALRSRQVAVTSPAEEIVKDAEHSSAASLHSTVTASASIRGGAGAMRVTNHVCTRPESRLGAVGGRCGIELADSDVLLGADSLVRL